MIKLEVVVILFFRAHKVTTFFSYNQHKYALFYAFQHKIPRYCYSLEMTSYGYIKSDMFHQYG